jgi:hypothetical protein
MEVQLEGRTVALTIHSLSTRKGGCSVQDSSHVKPVKETLPIVPFLKGYRKLHTFETYSTLFAHVMRNVVKWHIHGKSYLLLEN